MGTGYAAFRVANDNGAIDGGYPTNIHVGKLVARGGGRGFFCVTRSGGLVIDHIDIADTGNNALCDSSRGALPSVHTKAKRHISSAVCPACPAAT